MKNAVRGLALATAGSIALGGAPAKGDYLNAVGNPAAQRAATLFTLTNFVTGLTEPTGFAFLPDGRMLITEKGGNLLIADKNGATALAGTFTVDTESEKGLLHVIVHPDFATNRLLVFYYSANDSIGGTDLDRHRVVTVPLDANDKLDMTQEKILVRGLRGPANHDGGALAIGVDGKLYIGDGDTGCNSGQAPEPVQPPTNFFATCLTVPNGKILRVNLDGSIPNDNPLVNSPQVTACGTTCGTDVTGLAPAAGTAIRKDIWAWGFRNPWSFWVDKQTGNLWVGDVGEITYEEINVIPPTGGGKHYGWPWREGPFGHPLNTCQSIDPNAGDCVDPQYFCYHQGGGNGVDGNCGAIVAGVIVDSCDWPAAYRGQFYFGDYSRKWITSLTVSPDRKRITQTSGRHPFVFTQAGGPTHIDTGPDGALYYTSLVAGQSTGTVARVAPKNPAPCPVVDAGSAGSGGSAGSDGSAAGAGAQAGGSPNGGSSGAAGAAGSDHAGGTSSSDGSAKDSDASTGAVSRDDGGCGCRVTSNANDVRTVMLSATIGTLVFARRRRRATR